MQVVRKQHMDSPRGIFGSDFLGRCPVSESTVNIYTTSSIVTVLVVVTYKFVTECPVGKRIVPFMKNTPKQVIAETFCTHFEASLQTF